MSEEKLRKIKDSINLQKKVADSLNVNDEILQEEIDLYNEVIRLQQKNRELKEALEGTTHCFDEEEHQRLAKENKKLKEKRKKIQFEYAYAKIVHNAFQIEKREKRYYEDVLTEFEKWLEEKLKDTYANNDIAKGYKNALNVSLYKLQKLKRQ